MIVSLLHPHRQKSTTRLGYQKHTLVWTPVNEPWDNKYCVGFESQRSCPTSLTPTLSVFRIRIQIKSDTEEIIEAELSISFVFKTIECHDQQRGIREDPNPVLITGYCCSYKFCSDQVTVSLVPTYFLNWIHYLLSHTRVIVQLKYSQKRGLYVFLCGVL